MARRFFYDCEFMEEPGFLELISIGVVGGMGEEVFYMGNAAASFSRADDWVKDNVLSKLPPLEREDGSAELFGGYGGSKYMSHKVNRSNGFWFSRDVMAKHLLGYLSPSKDDPVEMHGYYSAYDHVLLCWIFGRMIDLPTGMPWVTLDIKQEMIGLGLKRSDLPSDPKDEHNALADARWNRDAWLRIQELKAVM